MSFAVKVDPTNPGQFFACCGLLELADRLWPGAESWFADGAFLISCAGELNELIEAFCRANLTSALTPAFQTEREVLEQKKRDLKRANKVLDAREEARRKELGKLFRVGNIYVKEPFRLTLDWWQSDDDAVPKTWAGSQAVIRIARAALASVPAALSTDSIFDYGCVMRASDGPDEGDETSDADDEADKVEPYYFDSRRCPNAHPRDVGFSVNRLGLTTTAHPAVELLCLVGLQRCLPAKTDEPRVYDYFTWAEPLGPNLLPAIVSGLLPHVGATGYRFENWYRTGQKKHKAFRSAVPHSKQGAQ